MEFLYVGFRLSQSSSMLRQFNYHVIGLYFISLAALQRFRRDSGAILTRFYLDRAITYMTCLVSIKCVVHVHVMVSGLVHSNVIKHIINGKLF